MTRWIAPCAALAMLVAPLASPAAQSADFDWSGEIAAGATLRVFSSNGAITVREAAGRQVRVRGETRNASRGDIRFVAERDGGDIRICAMRDEGRCTNDGIRNEDGWRRWNDGRARADLYVEIPRGVILRVSSGNGEVFVEGATADVHASSGNGRVTIGPGAGQVRASSGNGTVRVDRAQGPVNVSSGNGRIYVTTSMGPVEASTGNGDVDISMDAMPRTGSLRISSGNGRITLRAPADFSAEIHATTGNGGFETDFPIRLTGGISRNRVRGTIGNGDQSVRISTGSGSIRLLRVGS